MVHLLLAQDDDGFCLSKRSNRKKRQRSKNNTYCSSIAFDYQTGVDSISFRPKYSLVYQDFITSPFWKHTKTQLDIALSRLKLVPGPDVEFLMKQCSISPLATPYSSPCNPVSTIITFGLGNFTKQIVSLHQLAFASALRHTYLSEGDAKSNVCINYDPCYTSQEKNLLTTDFGQRLLNDNGECGYDVSEFTNIVMAFMPHCEKEHYQNFIATNFRPEVLGKVILISNSLASIHLRTPRRIMSEKYPHLLEILEHVTEYPLDNKLYTHNDVFNDLSIHTFYTLPV